MLARERELAETEAELAEVEAENEALRGKADPEKKRRVAAEPARSKAEGAAYRSEDALIRIERQIQASNAALATEQIEHAILQSRKESQATVRARKVRRVAIPVAVLLVHVFVTWFLLESVALMLGPLAVIGAGWLLLAGINAIKPEQRSKTRS